MYKYIPVTRRPHVSAAIDSAPVVTLSADTRPGLSVTTLTVTLTPLLAVTTTATVTISVTLLLLVAGAPDLSLLHTVTALVLVSLGGTTCNFPLLIFLTFYL